MHPWLSMALRFGELQWNHAEFALGGRGIISGKLGTVGFVAHGQGRENGEKNEMNFGDILGGGNSNISYFHLYLGKIPILTTIFQMG